MKKVLMFLSKGFEDLGAVTFIDVLGWTGVRDYTEPIKLKTCAFHDEATGRFGIIIKMDFNIYLEKINFSEFDAFVLSSGFHSHGFDVASSEKLYRIAREFHKRNKSIATLSVSVHPVSDSGLLNDNRATKYNLSRYRNNHGSLQKEGKIYTGKLVEYDYNIIYCADPTSSLEVAYNMRKLLTGK